MKIHKIWGCTEEILVLSIDPIQTQKARLAVLLLRTDNKTPSVQIKVEEILVLYYLLIPKPKYWCKSEDLKSWD